MEQMTVIDKSPVPYEEHLEHLAIEMKTTMKEEYKSAFKKGENHDY